MLRVTERQNALVADTLQWVFDEAQSFRKNFKSKTPTCVMSHASLPCTGGCPWNNVNGQTQEGQAKIQEHKALCRKLLQRLDKLITVLRQLDTVLVVNMELPLKNCMFGVVDKEGNLLQSYGLLLLPVNHWPNCNSTSAPRITIISWTVQGPSKRAESYTYEMADLIHECFSEFADSMKKFVTDSSAQKASRALVARKLPSPLAAMASCNLGEHLEGNLESWSTAGEAS